MLIEEIKILKHHGKQFVPDVTKVELTSLFRGRPVIQKGIESTLAERVSKICPVAAIQTGPLRIDIGKCLFCKECEFQSEGNIKFTNDYKISAIKRDDLIIYEGDNKPISIEKDKVRSELRKLFKHSLKLRQVSAGGDNSCEWELNAAGNVNFDMGRFGIDFVASPRHADGIVITGPITKNMARALQITYDAIPEPKLVVLVGTDAISGGIYESSKALDRSFLDQIKVDLYVPGNPAHPLTFINGLLSLLH